MRNLHGFMREAYFNFLWMQKRQMAHMKSTVKKMTVREDRGKPGYRCKPKDEGKTESRGKPVKVPRMPGTTTEHKWRIRPGTRALMGIRKFQKSTSVLILKWFFNHIVQEILQAERAGIRIQASAVLALHEAAEVYLVQLLRTAIFVLYIKEDYSDAERYPSGKANKGEMIGRVFRR